MANGNATHASIFDTLARMHPVTQVLVVLIISVGGAGGGAGMLATLTQGPRFDALEDRQDAMAETLQQLDDVHVDYGARINLTRELLDDLNLQVSHLTCRTERGLDPEACDAIRQEVRSLLERSAARVRR